MSLINKMLTDLDSRFATAGEKTHAKDTGLPPMRKGRPRSLRLVVLLIGAIGAGALAWSQYPRLVAAARSPSPLPMATPAVTPAPPPLAVGAAGPAATPQAHDAASEPAPTPPRAPVQAAAAAASAVDTAQAPAAHAAPRPVALPADEHPAAKPAPLAKAPGHEGQPLQDAPAQARRQGTAEARSIDSLPSPFKVVSPQQRSANLYRQAIESIQQSRTAEAQQALRQSLAADASNDDARLLLAELLANGGSNGEALALLRAALDGASGQRAGFSGLAMALARLQVAGGAKTEALATLEHGLVGAADNAEYHAFLAALLQGQGRHAEAAQHYITALRSDPAMPNWLIGVGISLQAENKLSDAREAFQRAIDTEELSPEVAQFANERLKQMRRAH